MISPAADAATKAPTPKATITKAPSPKPTITKKATSTPKPVVKKKVVAKKKKVVAKRKPRKKKSLSPSPSPKWPPIGFKSNGEVFAKIPTAKELIGTASSNSTLAKQLAQLVDGKPICEKYSCGAVQLASLNGCLWWEINATLIGPTSADDKTVRTFGSIRTLIKASAPKEVITALLVSQELLELNHSLSG
ncbi:MAG: hypothetical protein F2680_06295, partial [Actinobacteria bacterium]|nr:hypothetical protein [Actinomycetota bacterium]